VAEADIGVDDLGPLDHPGGRGILGQPPERFSTSLHPDDATRERGVVWVRGYWPRVHGLLPDSPHAMLA
jgi:hypothetical protein